MRGEEGGCTHGNGYTPNERGRLWPRGRGEGKDEMEKRGRGGEAVAQVMYPRNTPSSTREPILITCWTGVGEERRIRRRRRRGSRRRLEVVTCGS